MEIGGNGFLKLQEDSSRKSSFRNHNLELKGGLPYVTRINCGCGRCFGFRVKVEKEDGSLRIGRLTLAANCHLILLIFGFCFLLAGAILTALAYKAQIPRDETPQNAWRNDQEYDPQARKDEKIAGPLCVIVGSGFVFLGFSLAILGYKLNREARRQRAALSRFSLESPSNSRSPDIHSEFYSAFDDLRRVQDGESCQRNRQGSVFGSSFNNSRRSTLATIAQAVPVGFFMSDSPRTPKTPGSPNPDANGFQEIELSSPKKTLNNGSNGIRRNSSEDNQSIQPPLEYTKPSLSLRPSLPIPMFGIPFTTNNRTMGPLDPRGLVFSSRSDEPFGSIASLSGTGDIACFPVTTSAPPANSGIANHVPLECVQESLVGLNQELSVANTSRGLPPIKVNEMGNALTASQKIGLTPGGKSSSEFDESQRSVN